MRVDGIHLERYGIFSDKKLSFDAHARLHIVLGANEAGKTSALSAISDFMFGFGARTSFDFKHESKLLRVGGMLRHSDGRIVVARRRKGNKNTLVDENDKPLPDDLLDPFTAGISRDIFLREFGLTAAALRIGGEELLNAGGRLAETLAASSAGMSALSRLTTQLKSEAEEIFTPRKSSGKSFYAAVDRRDQADQKLRATIVTRDVLKEANQAFDAASRRLETLNESHGALGKSLALCRRALRVRQALSRLDALDNELKGIEFIDASEHQLTVWHNALERLAVLQAQISGLDEAEATDASELETLSVDEGLLAEGPAIDALRERLGAVRKAADDLPRRRQARDAAAGSLDDAARKLALPSHTDILRKLPSAMALAEARDLIDKRRGAELALTEADSRCTRLRRERNEYGPEDQRGHLINIDHLRERFDAIGDVAAQAERLAREVAALGLETESIAAGLSALTPSAGVLDKLRSLPIPDPAVIGLYAKQYATTTSDLRIAEGAIASAAKTIAADEAELARLSREGATATRDDLLRARLVRDDAFSELKASLGSDSQHREQRLKGLARSMETIDTVTDQLLADTERATRLADIRLRIEEGRRESEAQTTLRDDIQLELTELQTRWRQIWVPSGVTPEPPELMLRWREKIDGLIARLNACDTKKTDIAVFDMSLAERKRALISVLESAGSVADPSLPADVLFREAKACLDQLQNAWTEARMRSATKARIERELEEAEAARISAQQFLERISSKWAAVMTGISLAAGASAAEAEAAIGVWQSIPVIKSNYEREGRSVDSIESDLRAFDNDVSDIVDRIAPQLCGSRAEESLNRLVAELEGARRSAEGQRRLDKRREERGVRRRSLAVDIEAVNVKLKEACRTLSAANVESLPDVLDRIETRLRLVNEQAKLRRELPSIADGLGEAALRQEMEGLDFDSLQSRIDREVLLQQQVLTEIAEVSADKHQKKVDRDALAAGRDGEAAAAERAAANAEILFAAESWLRRAAAVRLGGLAIERYRSILQDPLVALAGSFFCQATNRAFAGLSVEYGADDQPTLVARRRSDETVGIDGLSEGTRDQLFLSLRLALLAQRTSEPMPFIGDDLLTSFDEERTEATLRLLATAGLKHQIILFTHHRHVADIGNSISEHKIDLVTI